MLSPKKQTIPAAGILIDSPREKVATPPVPPKLR